MFTEKYNFRSTLYFKIRKPITLKLVMYFAGQFKVVVAVDLAMVKAWLPSFISTNPTRKVGNLRTIT